MERNVKRHEKLARDFDEFFNGVNIGIDINIKKSMRDVLIAKIRRGGL